jgi:hypothetical protein
MREKLFTLAIFSWFAAIFACGLGIVKIFGPVAILLMGFILSADRSQSGDRFGKIMVTLITAGSILLGLWW